jgi:hypothetical protein
MPNYKIALMAVLLMCRSLIAGTTSVNSINKNDLQITCPDASHCQLSFTTKDGVEHRYQMELDADTFTSGATVEAFGTQYPVATLQKAGPQRFKTAAKTQLWGVALINIDNKENVYSLAEGVFLTPHQGIYEWTTQSNDGVVRDQSEDPAHEDIALPLPAGQTHVTYPNGLANDPSYQLTSSAQTTSNQATPADTNGVTPFYPGCYPFDTVSNTIKVSIAVDYGFYQSAAGTNVTPAQGLANTLAKIESVVSVARLIYLLQLNIYIQIDKIVIGNASSPTPLNRSNNNGTCSSALGAFSEFGQWNSQQSAQDPTNLTGVWMLLSNCFSGIVGVSYIGSYCGSLNASVAASSWLVFAHELGHAIGASHTFQNGIGTTGGLMDYGDGTYNGVAQFYPTNRQEICPFMTGIKNLGDKCQFFPVTPASASCGDGIMAPTEQCECLTKGLQSCGACVGCQIKKNLQKTVQCSARQFIFRTPNSKNYVNADTTNLSHTDCCNAKGKLAAPKTLCNGKLDVCSIDGACEQICTKYLEYNNPNCGFDASGCQLGCQWNNQCRFDLTFNDGTLLSQVSNGTSCYIDPKKKTLGTCQANGCAPK